jgi:hypothetical protein
MKVRNVFLALALMVLASSSAWAQEKKANPELAARLEQLASESDWKVRTSTGAPKQKWLLHQRKIGGLVDRLKAGQSVDPKEIDQLLREHYQ